MFKGCCLSKDGSYTEAVNLNTPEEVVKYYQLQMKTQYEVKIIDKNDCVVLFAKEDRVVYLLDAFKDLIFRL